MSVSRRRSLISPAKNIPVQRQCNLLGLERSSYYYAAKESEQYTQLMNEIMDIWLEYPFYGYRRIRGELVDRRMCINHKCVLRLMRLMGLRVCAS